MTSSASSSDLTRLIAVVLAALVLVAPGRARADLAPAPVEADGDAYERDYRAGLDRFDAQDWAAARAAFWRAYAVRAEPRLLFNIGSTYRREGDRARAVGFYRRFVALAPDGDPQRRFALEVLARLERTPPPRARGISPTRVAGTALVIVGLGGLGFAGYEAHLASTSSVDLAARAGQPWTTDSQALLDRGQRAERLARWSAIGGGATVVVGLAFAWLGGRTDPPVVVAPRHDGGVISVSGRF